MAKAPKGEKRGIEVAASLWVDLLAYGSMLEAAQRDPTSDAASAALERIVEFQRLIAKHSNRNFPTFVMNDGAIVFRDMSPRSRGVTFDFLKRAIALHREVNDVDRAAGYPGARAVLAVGLPIHPLQMPRPRTAAPVHPQQVRMRAAGDVVVAQGQFPAFRLWG